jgi:hypothetical protein
MNRILVLLAALLLAGCSDTFDIELEPEVTVFVGNSNGLQIRLTNSDQEYLALAQWLRENRSSWMLTSGRYSGGVYIQTGEHGIQVTESTVVIYSTQGSDPQAIYIQNIKKSELGSIKSIGQGGR